MVFENTCTVYVPCARLWDYMMLIPNVARCLPGVEEVIDLGNRNFAGHLTAKLGIIKMRLSGKISLESVDEQNRVAVMAVEATDEKISGLIKGRLTMNLKEIAVAETKLTIQTDLKLLGKVGEFGQSIIKKKADQMMAEFAKNVSASVGQEGSFANSDSQMSS